VAAEGECGEAAQSVSAALVVTEPGSLRVCEVVWMLTLDCTSVLVRTDLPALGAPMMPTRTSL
jgi:hypothetical protein